MFDVRIASFKGPGTNRRKSFSTQATTGNSEANYGCNILTKLTFQPRSQSKPLQLLSLTPPVRVAVTIRLVTGFSVSAVEEIASSFETNAIPTCRRPHSSKHVRGLVFALLRSRTCPQFGKFACDVRELSDLLITYHDCTSLFPPRQTYRFCPLKRTRVKNLRQTSMNTSGDFSDKPDDAPGGVSGL